MWSMPAPAWEGGEAAEAALLSRGTTAALSPGKINFPQLLGLVERAPHALHCLNPPFHLPPNGWTTDPPIHEWRIPSSRAEHVCTPGTTNWHAQSAFMAHTHTHTRTHTHTHTHTTRDLPYLEGGKEFTRCRYKGKPSARCKSLGTATTCTCFETPSAFMRPLLFRNPLTHTPLPQPQSVEPWPTLGLHQAPPARPHPRMKRFHRPHGPPTWHKWPMD